MSFSVFPTVLLAFLAALVLTGAIRQWALAQGHLDHPNERSSHDLPVPRSGGLAFVVPMLLAVAMLWLQGGIEGRFAFGFVAGGTLVMLAGLADDLKDLKVRYRLPIHMAAAAILLWGVGGLPPLNIAGEMVDLGRLGDVLAFFLIVWLINLMNFFDGVDGVAASAASFYGAGSALMGALLGFDNLIFLSAVFTAASMGFLFWNLSPFRIFMGDAGSGFLGFAMAAIGLYAAQTPDVRLWPWAILALVPVADTSAALLRRLVHRRHPAEAHRTHAYQHLADRLGTHRRVTAFLTLLNALLVLPLALAAFTRPESGFVIAVGAGLFLVGAALLIGAGKEPAEES